MVNDEQVKKRALISIDDANHFKCNRSYLEKVTSPITFPSPSPSLLFGRSTILKQTSGGIGLLGSTKSIQLTMLKFGGVVGTLPDEGDCTLKSLCSADPSSSWRRIIRDLNAKRWFDMENNWSLQSPPLCDEGPLLPWDAQLRPGLLERIAKLQNPPGSSSELWSSWGGQSC